ncbi:MAG: choice-of-anchor D domain-containing protein, partial [Tepidisphaeraceae bacterium]
MNPQTGDTFVWTVDKYNQDQGIWQDLCAASAGNCANLTITFAQQWQTAALETNVLGQGSATIVNGDYNLALAAVPSGQTTIVFAGANDLWKTSCPYSQGCRWRNTTNSTVGFCAGVGEYQHALAWNPVPASNPLEIFVGNDSGLWRSTDAIGETGTVCSASDASHFENLNGSLGSLAEVESISQAGATPYTMMAGLGANGTAGVKSTTGTTTDWPEILGGEGGPVAVDPTNSANWYVNNQAGVSIYLCSQTAPCTPAAFGASAVVTDADVGGDGLSMTSPAPFLVDPLDSTKLLIGTCRVWRGPASGVGWSSSDAISPIFDNHAFSGPCSGDALIRTMAAMALPVSTALPSGGEVVYVGMYGSANGGGTLPGHVLSTYNSATGTWSAWTDVTALNPVSNDTHTMNYYGYDITSIFVDPHDTTGQTVYVTVAGIPSLGEKVQTVYSSTDGGMHWTSMMANLPAAPANSLVVDPQSASTVYVATDEGVYSTRQIASCASALLECWSAYGSGLPEAPVVALSAAPVTASVHDLVAATYGRGIWINPLWGASGGWSGPATDTISPTTLTFSGTIEGQLSSAQTVTLTNSGGVPLTSIAISVSGAFQQTNDCTASLAANSSCAINVQFDPAATGTQTGTLSGTDSTRTQPETVALSGTGVA